MKQKKEIIWRYVLIAFFAVCGIAIFTYLIYWGINVPNTAGLWSNGAVNGWIFLISFAALVSSFTLLPICCIYDEIDLIKNSKY